MVRTPPTQAELAALAENHLHYEVAMLRGSIAEYSQRYNANLNITTLPRNDAGRIACMAFFEVVLLHSRILDEFLVGPPRQDDVVAADYIPNWVPPAPRPLDRVQQVAASALVVRSSINKQLAHFSLERLQQSRFYVEQVANEVLHDIAVFANDTANTCHAELQAVRDLLLKNPWTTENPPPPPPQPVPIPMANRGTLAGGS